MIELTADEKAALGSIKLDASALENGEPARKNCAEASRLTKSLLARETIPKIRLSIFCDDNYATVRGKSPRRRFLENCASDDEIFLHPHFLDWLRYFIYGPSLPDSFTSEFSAKVDSLGSITSGDHETLRHFVRSLVKEHRLLKSDVDEIYKLALEVNLSIDLSHTLRREALKVAERY